MVTLQGAGTATITANKAEDTVYQAATSSYVLVVSKGEQTGFSFAQPSITIAYVARATTSNIAQGDFGAGAVTYFSHNEDIATVDNNGKVTLKGAGLATITAEKPANDNYNAIAISYVLQVDKGKQTDFRFAEEIFTVRYEKDQKISNILQGGQGLGAITYDIDNGDVASINNDGELTLKSIGTATVTATKAGDDDYLPTFATYTLNVVNAKELFMTLGIKHIKFTWNATTGTDHYRLRSNLGHFDPAFVDASTSGFVVVPNSTNIKQTTAQADIALHRYVPLVDRPQYQIDKCDDANLCDTNAVSDSLSNADFNKLIGYFKASNTRTGNDFGTSISLSDDGNTLAVGANREFSNAKGVDGNQDNHNAVNSGAVYVFVRDNNSAEWKQQAYIKASNTDLIDNFGFSVSLSDDGNTLAVGAPQEDSNSTGVGGAQGNDNGNFSFNAGAVYVFTRNSSATWSQQAYVKASNTDEADFFGNFVSLSDDGNTLAVAAPFEDSNSTGVGGAQGDVNDNFDAGAVYVFTRSSTGTWSQQAYIKASNTDKDDQFGHSVSISGDGNTLAVGAPEEDSNSTGVGGAQGDVNDNFNAGAVYVFTRSSTTWSQQAYIKASNTDSGDQFGTAVSLSGDGNTLAVGAPYEDSNSTGINSVENNNFIDSGATYVFTRSSTGAWSQQAYIKANIVNNGDSFGHFVSLSGDGNSLAVSAINEDGNAEGVGGVYIFDGKHNNSGAVYFFTRSGSTWQQQAYVKASNTGANDDFGHSLSLSGDGNSLAVGVPKEDSSAKGIGGAQGGGANGSGAVYLY